MRYEHVFAMHVKADTTTYLTSYIFVAIKSYFNSTNMVNISYLNASIYFFLIPLEKQNRSANRLLWRYRCLFSLNINTVHSLAIDLWDLCVATKCFFAFGSTTFLLQCIPFHVALIDCYSPIYHIIRRVRCILLVYIYACTDFKIY